MERGFLAEAGGAAEALKALRGLGTAAIHHAGWKYLEMLKTDMAACDPWME